MNTNAVELQLHFPTDQPPTDRERQHLQEALAGAIWRSRAEGQLTPDESELQVGEARISLLSRRERPDLQGKVYHLLLKAYPCGEADEAPLSAYYRIDQDFVNRLFTMADAVDAHDLAYAEAWHHPSWQGNHRTDTERLCVGKEGFFWAGYLKYVDVRIETTQVDFPRLLAAMADADRDGRTVIVYEIDRDEAPEALEPLACRKVEWHPQYVGGEWSGHGNLAYLRHADIASYGLEQVFTRHTGYQPLHIIHIDEDASYTPDGERIEL